MTEGGSATEGQPFNPEWLRETAQRLARETYIPLTDTRPPWLAAMNYDDYQALNNFRAERSLWGGGELPFQARFFHLGLYFHHPVRLYEVADGVARPIHFSPDLYKYGPRVKDRIPEAVGDLGFAGFRVNSRADWDRDMFAFLGASYFRAVGASKQYGLSARGLAIDTGLDRPEEFPAFRAFWLERPAPNATALTLHALLDGPSITGAYRFVVTPGDTTVMRVEARLFPRRPIERLAWRCGRARANGFGGHSSIRTISGSIPFWTITRAASACCNAIASSPTTRTTSPSTTAGRRCGWNRSETGAGARCN